MNVTYFGICYTDDSIYIGIEVVDQHLYPEDRVEVFIDGDASGGAYDEYDVYMVVDFAGAVTVITGPPGGVTPNAALVPDALGYNVEVAIAWSDLSIIPEEGERIRFDVVNGDSDTGAWDYSLSWNGSTNNYSNTTDFGEVVLGALECGCISLYSPEIGDVRLRRPTDLPHTYVATFEFYTGHDVVFRQDKADHVTWGASGWPNGTAVIGGPQIPGQMGRYRINFDCITGEYIFESEPAGSQVAYIDFTDFPPVIDGDLEEYDLQYGSDILVSGIGPVNNTVSWGGLWDLNSFYIGVSVIDDQVEGSGNPWDNDAIEFYFDGNNDKDGSYDSDFDNQMILDALNQSVPWLKADGVPITDYESKFLLTSDGYHVEIRLGWGNIDFEPANGRVIGWSLANDDSDHGIGRDYQTVWYGTGNNWNNTADLGDLQMQNGPPVRIQEPLEGESVNIYPNPASDYFIVQSDQDIQFIAITDVTGRIRKTIDANNTVSTHVVIPPSSLEPGVYMVMCILPGNSRIINKLIIR
jgi:hypothetical protein